MAGCTPRIPLALTPDHYDTWLDPHHQNTEDLCALLSQPADGLLNARPVSTAVNNVRSQLASPTRATVSDRSRVRGNPELRRRP
ncbi:SOS response-associated peptidase family protein [Streptomyces sp. NPDC056707]|uniref:SOS response-associated peptidase family protein n=1 Tax=Streptomyces sp. NPDC056707 TaxID=3345919 RepID=UPI0036823D98